MKKRQILTSFMLLLMTSLLLISGCAKFGSSNERVIKNTVENEITNKVVDYQEFSVESLESAVTQTVEKVKDAVIGVTLKYVHEVTINGRKVTSIDTEAIGSGVIYKRVEKVNDNNVLTNFTYYVLTNRHVITSSYDESKVYVYLGSEDLEIEARVIGYDSKVDLAVIAFDHYTYINPVTFKDSDELNNGEFVIAIGNPDGYDYYGSVTFGVVSGKLRYISDDTDGDGINDFNATYIQHDASINPGNSGGGLFTIDGKLVGINSLKFVDDKIDNMGFAIPSNVAKTLAIDYIEKNIVAKRPTLGITGTDIRTLTNAIIAQNGLLEIPDIYNGASNYGIYVRSIIAGGTISASNVKENDIILTFDGEKLTNMNVLSAKLNSLDDYLIGTTVEITYYSRSNNKIMTESIVLQ